MSCFRLLRHLAAVALLAAALCACALYRNDRMWISEAKFQEARRMYDETGSLDLTTERMRQSGQWQQAEINEALYRLRKQYRLE